MAAPVVESFITAQGNGSSFVSSVPSGIVSGDLLFASIISDGNPTITAPSGFLSLTSIAGSAFGALNVKAEVFHRFSTGAEPDSYSFTFDAEESFGMGMARISGVDVTTPISAVNVGWDNIQTGNTTLVLPSITTDVNDTLLVHCPGTDKNQSGPILTAPGGSETVLYDLEQGGSAGVLFAMAHEAGPSTAGATGTKTWTTRSSEEDVGIFVALNPELPGGGGGGSDGSGNSPRSNLFNRVLREFPSAVGRGFPA